MQWAYFYRQHKCVSVTSGSFSAYSPAGKCGSQNALAASIHGPQHALLLCFVVVVADIESVRQRMRQLGSAHESAAGHLVFPLTAQISTCTVTQGIVGHLAFVRFPLQRLVQRCHAPDSSPTYAVHIFLPNIPILGFLRSCRGISFFHRNPRPDSWRAEESTPFFHQRLSADMVHV